MKENKSINLKKLKTPHNKQKRQEKASLTLQEQLINGSHNPILKFLNDGINPDFFFFF